MGNLIIRCDSCKGICWIEYISSSHVDVACIYCGKRNFYPTVKFKQFVKKVNAKYAERLAKGRVLATQG